MNFAFIAAERVNHAVSTLCRAIGTNPARLLRLASRRLGVRSASVRAGGAWGRRLTTGDAGHN
jgi:hypothetical protein